MMMTRIDFIKNASFALSIRDVDVFAFFPFFLSIGIGLFFSTQWEVSRFILHTITICSILIALVFRRWAVRNESFETLYIIATMTCAVFIGYSASMIRTNIMHSPILHNVTTQLTLQGVVENVDIRTDSMRMYLSHIKVTKWNKEIYGEIPKIVRINSHHTKHNNFLKIGAIIEVNCVLSPPPKPILPNAFDLARHIYFKQIGAIGYAIQAPRVAHGVKHFDKWWHIQLIINNIRQNIANRITLNMDNNTAAIAKGILVGDASGINQSDWEALRAAGTAHLIAVSGMHIAVVSGLVFFIVRFLLSLIPAISLRYDSKKIAAIVAIILTLIYLLLAGSPISGQRSFFMAAIVLIGILVDRDAHGVRCITIAAIVILLITPESLFSASLQMSFAASLVLVANFQYNIEHLKQSLSKQSYWQKCFIYAANLIVSSLLASLATMPFILYHFQQFSPYSVIANFFCVPLSDFVFMPAGMIALILMPLHIEWLPLYVMKLGINFMMLISHSIHKLPQAIIHVNTVHDTGLIAISIAIFLLCISKNRMYHISIPLIIYWTITLGMQNPTPALIISGGRKLFAVSLHETQHKASSVSTINRNASSHKLYKNDVLVPSSLIVERYVREMWKNAYEDKIDVSKNLNKYNIKDCNSNYCLWQQYGKIVMIIASQEELELHEVDGKMVCPPNTDIFVNMHDDRVCEHAKIRIVAKDLDQHGTHVVYFKRRGAWEGLIRVLSLERSGDSNGLEFRIEKVSDYTMRQFR